MHAFVFSGRCVDRTRAAVAIVSFCIATRASYHQEQAIKLLMIIASTTRWTSHGLLCLPYPLAPSQIVGTRVAGCRLHSLESFHALRVSHYVVGLREKVGSNRFTLRTVAVHAEDCCRLILKAGLGRYSLRLHRRDSRRV